MTPPPLRAAGGLSADPISVGSMLFTLVDPHRGAEQRYHRWYERDHFYSNCLSGPGLFAGRRFVATRDLKALRSGEREVWGQPIDAGSFLAVYWIESNRHDEWLDWSTARTEQLGEHGRLFDERDHVHTKLYLEAGRTYREPDPVPLELALDHPFAGLVAVAQTPDAQPPAPRGPVSIVSSWTAAPPRADGPALLDRGALRMSLMFVDTDPAEAWDAIEATTRAAGGVAWLAAFKPTIPGSDRYVDELWNDHEIRDPEETGR
jgi:hypothetical protein